MRRHLYEWPLNSCQQQLRTTMLTFSSGIEHLLARRCIEHLMSISGNMPSQRCLSFNFELFTFQMNLKMPFVRRRCRSSTFKLHDWSKRRKRSLLQQKC
eukprot:symbB.v1.2.011070.t1/scaffold738.1/size167167/4